MTNKASISGFFKQLQDKICADLEILDNKSSFKEDVWKREGGGGGCTRVIEQGGVFEKCGVNFSEVYGKAPIEIFKTLELEGKEKGQAQFYATGVSIVIHPISPMVPIIHMNTRYFKLTDAKGLQLSEWFGGGIDLTPLYVVDEDAQFFHQQMKLVCDRYDPTCYKKYKSWADDYFYIKHRKETRGIGGIFFDRLVADEHHSMKDHFEFIQEVGNSFYPTYSVIVERNKDFPFGKQEVEWQQLRRGRYVEFNLVYDRGTTFGLQTGGRTESILMSLPETATWKYKFDPESGSKEEQTLKKLVKGIDWIG